MKYYLLAQDTESKNLKSFNLSLRNGSKNKTPPKFEHILGCFDFALIHKANVESFSNLRL